MSVGSKSPEKSIEISARPLGDTPSAANLGRTFIGGLTKPLGWGAESVRFAYAAGLGRKVPQINVGLSQINLRSFR
jgi:hypothetical protein